MLKKKDNSYTFMQFYLEGSMTQNKRGRPKINVMDLCFIQNDDHFKFPISDPILYDMKPITSAVLRPT